MKRILNAKILFSLVLAFALFAGILAATVHAADPTFKTVGITTGESLKEYLELDGNFIINVSADIHTWIGEPGDDSYWPPDVPYWCTLGSGIKVLDLHGFDVKLSYDKSNAQVVEDSWDLADKEYKEFYCTPMTMLRVPSGAELVINDADNTGEINYDAYMNIERVGIGDTFLENRNLIEVTGGKLTVNGGRLIAGRSKKFYNTFRAKDYYAQINGTAIILSSGQADIYGGILHGRGYVRINQYGADIRDAAVKATGGSLTIWGGEFWGKGCADVMQIGSGVNISVYGGEFYTHKQEQGIVFNILGTLDDVGGHYDSTSYGIVGIPGRAFQNVGTRTDVKVSGTGVLTAEQAAADATLNTSKDIEVYPVNIQSGEISQYTGSAYTKLAAGTTIEWDKVSNLNLLFNHDSYYPQNLTGVYAVYGHDSGETYAQICKLPMGSSEVVKLGHSGAGAQIVNLLEMSDDLKSKLEVGKTYYLTMYNIEKWTTPNDTYEILYNAHKQNIKVKIVEPDMTMPDLDIGLTWENSLNSSGKNQIKLVPTGDAAGSKISALIASGEFNQCVLKYYYDNQSDVRKIYTEDTDGGYAVGYGITFTDFYRGISQVKLEMELYKGDRFIGRKTVTTDVVCFPDITADRTIDSSNRILVSPSNTAVTLSCNANGITGLFWAKDGTKLSDSNKQKNYPVNVTGADKMGWYSLGYTVGNQQYISDQKIYLGVDGGSAKNLKITASATSCTLKADGDAMPTLTALASGSGLGTIKEYQWQNVSWPEGARPSAKRYSTTKYTVSIAEVFGCKGYETTQMAEGMYVFSCTAYDSYDQPVTSNTVSIYVSRPAQGLQIWHDSVTDSWHDIPSTGGEHQDVTDKFIVLYNEDDTDYLSAVFTPQNATTAPVAFNAMSDAVTVDNSGRIQAMRAGSATITATTGTGLSASTKVLVPKTRYDVTIPEDWLKVEAGAAVHRGTVPTSYADFTVELRWMAGNEGYSYSDCYEYDADTFAGNKIYYPVVTIRPKAGVCYPVNVEYRGNNVFWYSLKDNGRFVITVNGVEYFGANYCGKEWENFYGTEPISNGGSDDYIKLYLAPTEKIIDWRDEYITHAAIEIDVPKPGDPKDASPDADKLLDVRFITEGLSKTLYNETVQHVTDLSTINDQNTSNDAVEDFKTYQEGETYRYDIGIIVDSRAATPNGGRYYFADNVKMVEPELGAITNTAALEYGILYGYVYFTVQPTASGFGVASTLSGTVTSYGDEAGTVTIKLIPKGATEAAYGLTVRGNSAAYSIEDVAPGAYVLEVSKSKHATREYNITVGDDDVVKDLEILLYGDVTGEGSITTADVTQIKRYINGKTSKFDQGDAEFIAYLLKVANVTTADSLTTADVTQIKRYINGKSSIFDNLP